MLPCILSGIALVLLLVGEQFEQGFRNLNALVGKAGA
jgi:hypothetical protein